MTVNHGFKVEKPPFNDLLVRQASAAIDRREVAEEDTRFSFGNVNPATSLTLSDTLRRNLYGAAGMPMDLTRARARLGQAE